MQYAGLTGHTAGKKGIIRMIDYTIFVDSSADLEPLFLENHDIHIVGMHYTIGAEQCDCSVTESGAARKRFYDRQRNGEVCHTSQAVPQQFIDTFAPALESGRNVLYLSLSGGLTNMHNSIYLAKMELSEHYPNTHVYEFDSLSATGGIGLLAEIAVKNRDEGMSIEENVAKLEEMRARLCHLFMVEDLIYLKRGGRIPAATAVIGTALSMKPILVIDEEGKLRVVDKKRGHKAAIGSMLERYSQTKDDRYQRISIVHADAPILSHQLAEELAKRNPQAHISEGMLSPIIGAHTGPGMAAIIYFGDRSEIAH